MTHKEIARSLVSFAGVALIAWGLADLFPFWRTVALIVGAAWVLANVERAP